jgi:DNA mismatch repair protein MutL
MSDIKLLPDHLIDKIAAGEVVENPASVVKELIENALDAGAGHLGLAIEKGGTRSISLVDDGKGIPSEQVKLAFARHATSKIAEESDLLNISSYGFRGEALPAIASVSMVEMITGMEGANQGTRIVIEGGKETTFESAPPRRGTSITVRQLFYNTPARRKFLKAESSETRKITAIFSKYAICGHQLNLTLNVDGKEIVNYPSDSNLSHRLERIWGDKVGVKLIEIDSKTSEILHIYGYICRPEINRGNRNQTYLFVNGRPISDISLMHAIKAGYGNTLESGTFPIAAIFIDMVPDSVDVNVHPAKTEVRFVDERYIYSQLKKLVEAAIQTPVLFSVAPGADSATQVAGFVKIPSEELKQRPIYPMPPHEISIKNHRQGLPADIPNSMPLEMDGGEFPTEAAIEMKLGGHRFWQLYDTFIMGFRDGKVWMIDQHTAHERILYEAALNNLCERPGTSQRLLFDLTIELEPSDMAVIDKYLGLFGKLGFELELFGSRAVIIRGVPAYFQSSAIEQIFHNLLDGFVDSLSTGEDPTMALAASLACHAAVKSGERLSQEQMEGLFGQLFNCEEPYRCPHGRPTVATISRDDLDKLFKRR